MKVPPELSHNGASPEFVAELINQVLDAGVVALQELWMSHHILDKAGVPREHGGTVLRLQGRIRHLALSRGRRSS